ncbi:protein Fer3-like [Macrobrachium rosenbergii]|uniref:protein Fer3-like n=1 Tax=Macrobrachium rosenbergii TaxID=79674 RepID=UPI0034D6045E
MATCTDNITNKPPNKPSKKIAEKYSLRPRSALQRIPIDKLRELTSRKGASKSVRSRAPPLSKYRRKTANARERHRMKEINDAFEALRRTLPDFCDRRTSCSMTKITTLRLAVSYIRELSHILEDGDPRDHPLIDGLQVVRRQNGHQRVPYLPPNAGSDKFVHQQSYELYDHPLERSYNADFESSTLSSASSPARCSVSSADEFCDLISDGSSMFEDAFDTLDDISVLHEVCSFPVLLGTDGDVLQLDS